MLASQMSLVYVTDSSVRCVAAYSFFFINHHYHYRQARDAEGRLYQSVLGAENPTADIYNVYFFLFL